MYISLVVYNRTFCVHYSNIDVKIIAKVKVKFIKYTAYHSK